MGEYIEDAAAKRNIMKKYSLSDTIHWDPFVQTSDKGGSEIIFFNAEIPATIIIMVEGITGDGILIFYRTSYQVK